MKVAILRPEHVASETVDMFKKQGFDVISIPFIKIVPRNFEFDPRNYDVLIVTSRTAARIVVEKGIKHENVIAIGKKTAEELRKAGIHAKIPTRFDSTTLYEEFKDELKGKRVAILRSNRGDPILLNLPNVDEVILYDIEFEWGEKQKKFLNDLDFDVIVFSSRMTVKSFFGLADHLGIDIVERLKDKIVIAIGPPTREELSKYGIEALMPEEWTFDSILKLLKSIKTEQKS
ncbi:uroporphyrinogen-III synthase [Archaeoglobus profundus]|uniref:Uroporphyrinogen III synthase HEM4 n=1 Tax=Archaeoglobus profundus (strain DSM 5631 / JCM 9629 / NBRC 100127 / Av18) TaxID=572546 RepID=D2RGG8_ARCPA|nr:uroporphyrinogen-III synthase [Archaeoglobus profundus]ADB57393.1 Uroporphyrinogen III synthase HEM4 [Archaeoglobus profundus DSM 5631]